MDKHLKHDLRHEPKEVKIELDKERTLRYDLNAYSELDLTYEEKGKTYHQLEKDLGKTRPYAIQAFLWAGLLHEDPDLKIQDISGYVTHDNLPDVLDKIYEAILGDQPEHKQKADQKGPGKKGK